MRGEIAVCGGVMVEGRDRQLCPTDGRETDFLRSFTNAWYGDIWTCIECGDVWCDGERGERPFEPRWRAKRIVKARAAWEAALPLAEYLAAVSRAVEAELEPAHSDAGPTG